MTGIRLRRLTEADHVAVRRVFEDLEVYSGLVTGRHDPSRAARDFLTALPEGRTAADKHVFAIERDEDVVGLVDLIGDHPWPGTAYLGLLAVTEPLQHLGIGRAAFAQTEAVARDLLNAHTLRLGVLNANPVTGFWSRMGFRDTGEYRADATIMEKSLST